MISSEFNVRSPIAVVGNINLDIKTSPMCVSAGLFADGETSVDEIYESLGGGAANVATAAASLGGTVHFYGCVGADELGERLERALIGYGVIPHLGRTNVPTGRSINLNWNNHHRHFLSSLANNRAMTVDDIDLTEIADAGCHHLFRADIWFANEMLEGGNEVILKKAGELDMETSIDINSDPERSLPGNSDRLERRKKQVESVLPYVSWVHGNENELTTFANIPNIRDACRYLLDCGARGVIVHRGANGAAACDRATGWVESPPTRVKEIVCETGTGDVFSAVFMLLSDTPLPERLCKCGHIAARHLEGNPSLIPRLESRPNSHSCIEN